MFARGALYPYKVAARVGDAKEFALWRAEGDRDDVGAVGFDYASVDAAFRWTVVAWGIVLVVVAEAGVARNRAEGERAKAVGMGGHGRGVVEMGEFWGVTVDEGDAKSGSRDGGGGGFGMD